MKVMMIQLPHFYEGTKRAPTIYPLGIGYLVSVLKEYHEMIPLDLWIENTLVDSAILMIEKNVPDVFCISVYSTQYPYFKELVGRLKEKYPTIPIIAGGPGASFSYQVFLEKTKTDYCVIGEGEITLKELLANIDSAGDVSGIAFRNKDEIVVTPHKDQIKDLDSIPLPDRTFFDFEAYIHNAQKNKTFFNDLRRNSIISTRGCPYRCTFCSKTFSGSRVRSIEGLDKEIKMLKSEFNLEALEFGDELVLLNKKRAIEICEMMKRHNMPWGCQGRINLVDEEILQHLKNSECKYVGYGVESYTQSILDKMKKKIRVEQILPIIEMTQKYEIHPTIQYMYGYSGENDESIANTYQFFKQIDQPFIGMLTTPLPGSPLYDDVLARNLIIDEEAYLMKLTSGYNYSVPLVNLTDFSDTELVKKKFALEKMINRQYYMRHPLSYLKTIYSKMAYRFKMLFNNPVLFTTKVMSKVSTLLGR